jgi:O-antigen/teichoic acid export membrane protein
MAQRTTVTLRERLLGLAPILRPHWERLQKSPLGYRLARGAFWTLAGTVVSRGLSLLSSMLVARMVGKVGFGELGIIQSTVGMFGVLAGFGMGLAATKHVAQYRTEEPQRAGRIIVFMELVTLGSSALLFVALALAARPLAQHTLAAPQLASVLVVGGLLLPFSALNGVQTGSLSGLEAFRAIARVNLTAGLLSFPLVVAGAYLGGLMGAVAGLVASQAANCFLSHQALRAEAERFGITFPLAGCTGDRRLLWHFSLPAVLGNAASWGAGWGSSVILVNQVSGYADMGVVSVGNQWRAALMFLPGLLLNASLPMLASETNPAGFGRTLALAHKLISAVVLPVTLVLMLAAGAILSFYGTGFSSGRTALVYMLAAAAVSAVSSPAGSAIVARGNMWFSLGLNLINAVVYLLLSWWLAPSRGAEGVSLALFAAYLTQALLGYWYLRLQLPPGMFRRNLILMGAIGMVAIALQYLPVF